MTTMVASAFDVALEKVVSTTKSHGRYSGFHEALEIALTVYQETNSPAARRIVHEIFGNMKLEFPDAFK